VVEYYSGYPIDEDTYLYPEISLAEFYKAPTVYPDEVDTYIYPEISTYEFYNPPPVATFIQAETAVAAPTESEGKVEPPVEEFSSILDEWLNKMGFDSDPDPGDPGIWETGTGGGNIYNFFGIGGGSDEPPSSLLDAGLNAFGHDTDPEPGDDPLAPDVISALVLAMLPLMIIMPMMSGMFSTR